MKTTLLISIIGAIVLTFLLYLLSFVFKKKGQTRTATFIVFAISIISLTFAGRPLVKSIEDINNVYDKTDKYMGIFVTALAIVDDQINHEV